MAQFNTVNPTASFLWKTERPFRDITRKSCDFSLLGAKWCLEAHYYSENQEMLYKITLKKKTGTVSSRNYIDVTTVLDFNKYSILGSIACHRNQACVNSSEIIVWKYSEKSLTEAKGDFFTYGAWKIICTFHYILPSSELKIENKKVDSSTQMDEDTSATAEKGTQVSRDFSDAEKLSEDFSRLFRLSLYPDAKLRCGDRTLPVHRSVLAARSPAFDALFRDRGADAPFDVADLDDRTLDPFLEYAYSGTVRDLSDSSAVALHGAGRKYGMESLRKACSDWMILHLTEENCVGFLDAASDDAPLQEAVASFLCEHPEVFKSQTWSRFAGQQPSLAYKLLETYMRFAVFNCK